MTDGSPSKADESPVGIDLSRETDFELGRLTVRPAIREVAVGDAREILEPRVMQALTLLARRRGEVVSRDDLIASCWDGRIVGDDAINGCVAKVRRLGEAHAAFVIATVPRVGYRLAESSPAQPRTAARRPPWRWPIAAGVVVVAAAALAIAVWTLREPSQVQVAVLPFEASPGDPASQALAERVHDHIAEVLTARQVDVLTAGSPRRARLVVAGVLERTGEVAQVRVHIDDPRANLVLWQSTFQGPSSLDGPLADRAAAKVTDLLYAGVVVMRGRKGRLPPQALKSFLLGIDAGRDGKVAEPVELFRALRDREPGLAASHALYANALSIAAGGQPPAVATAWRAEAQQSALTARRLDPSEPRAYFALAGLAPRLQYAQREQILKDGLSNAPNDGGLHVAYGLLLAEVGRPRESLPYLRRGLALDPLSPQKQFGNATSYASLGEVAEARARLLNARRIWPQQTNVVRFFTGFAVAYAEPGEGRQIMSDLRRDYPDIAQEADIWLVYLRALECRCSQPEAGQVLWAAARTGRIDPMWVIPALVRLGQLDLAYQAAEQLIPNQSDGRQLFVDVTAPMRREARFMDLAARLSLTEYWLASNHWPEFCAEPGIPYDCKVEAGRATASNPKVR